MSRAGNSQKVSISHKTQDSMLGVIEMVPESYLGGGFNFV